MAPVTELFTRSTTWRSVPIIPPQVQITRFIPQNIPSEPDTKVNVPSIDPDTPVRALLSVVTVGN